MLHIHAATGSVATIAAQQVALEDTSRYGIIVPGEAGPEGSTRILDLVEKPGPEKAPSTLAVCARYVLSSAVFDLLRKTKPGHSGEVQLTDALQTLARQQQAYAVPLQADEVRWDVGSLKGYGQAAVKAWETLSAD